jgi:hypothetical protein
MVWTLRSEVKLFIRQTHKTEHIGHGFVELVKDFHPWLRWANIILNTDNTFYLRDLDAARKDGCTVVRASEELVNVFKKHGIDMPPSQEFNDYGKAIAFVKKNMERSTRRDMCPLMDADGSITMV